MQREPHDSGRDEAADARDTAASAREAAVGEREARAGQREAGLDRRELELARREESSAARERAADRRERVADARERALAALEHRVDEWIGGIGPSAMPVERTVLEAIGLGRAACVAAGDGPGSERARALRQQVIAVARDLARVEHEVERTHDEIAGWHPKDEARYRRAAALAREAAQRFEQIARLLDS